MYFMHDPLAMPVFLIGMALVFLPQIWVKNTVGRYSEVATKRGASGRDIARSILEAHGLGNISVEMVDGFLSDHYDPGARVIRLSPDVYQGSSVASVAVAAHECGHAIQHADGYYPIVIRAALAPAANLGSQFGPLLLLLSLGLGAAMHLAPGLIINIAWAGVILYGLAVAFHVVTLPVELDASGRALRVLEHRAYLLPDEMSGAKKVLTAAAFTYVATATYALLELMRFIFLLIGMSRRED